MNNRKNARLIKQSNTQACPLVGSRDVERKDTIDNDLARDVCLAAVPSVFLCPSATMPAVISRAPERERANEKRSKKERDIPREEDGKREKKGGREGERDVKRETEILQRESDR